MAATNDTQQHLFISYRAQDTGPTASRLHSELASRFGADSVFLDHKTLKPGDNWEEGFRAGVQGAVALLVLIGEQWLKISDPETGDRILNLPEDPLRQELETALRHHVPVVPILVDSAQPLTERALQTLPSISELIRIQSLRLRRTDWENDIDELFRLLDHRGFSRHLGTPAAAFLHSAPVPDSDATAIPRGDAKDIKPALRGSIRRDSPAASPPPPSTHELTITADDLSSEKIEISAVATDQEVAKHHAASTKTSLKVKNKIQAGTFRLAGLKIRHEDQ